MTADVLVRTERVADQADVFAINSAAFGQDAEAKLVDALRARADAVISLVAERNGEVVGHIMFSPVTIEAGSGLRLMGLAPMAVTPANQHEGVGSALVAAGLAECRQHSVDAVVVLGYPEYYPRFGFERASKFGLSCEYDVPDEAFMAIELAAGALSNSAGVVRYDAAFSEVS